jgi:hypothetical protein
VKIHRVNKNHYHPFTGPVMKNHRVGGGETGKTCRTEKHIHPNHMQKNQTQQTLILNILQTTTTNKYKG